MNKSETVSELFKALSKAQSEMHHAKADAENPHFRSTYADLASVWDAVRKPLTDNGLSILQLVEPPVSSEGRTILSTVLAHTSGEWIESRLPLLLDKQTSQGIGSALTYARRYALAAICGIAQEDDDGNAAEPVNHNVSRKQGPTPVSEKHLQPIKPQGQPQNGALSDAQKKRLFAIAKTAGFNAADIKSYMTEKYGIDSSNDLTRVQYDEICAHYEKLGKAQNDTFSDFPG